MSLRTLLIVVGMVVVLLVYAATAFKRRRDARARFDRRFARLDIPNVMLRHDDDEDDSNYRIVDDELPRAAAGPIISTLDLGTDTVSRLPDDVVLPRLQAGEADLPIVRNDIAPPAPEPSNARKRVDQMDLFGADQSAATHASVTPRKRAPRVPAPEPTAGLVTLYVRATPGQQFSGPKLVKALNAVGMQFGDMAIFHHFGAGELKCQEAIFSAANMYEPGTFNLNKIEAFRTAGVALFLQLPGPLDGAVAFELLLNTAQRLTELTGGELFVDPRTVLDAPAIARLRKRVARFAHVRP